MIKGPLKSIKSVRKNVAKKHVRRLNYSQVKDPLKSVKYNPEINDLNESESKEPKSVVEEEGGRAKIGHLTPIQAHSIMPREKSVPGASKIGVTEIDSFDSTIADNNNDDDTDDKNYGEKIDNFEVNRVPMTIHVKTNKFSMTDNKCHLSSEINVGQQTCTRSDTFDNNQTKNVDNLKTTTPSKDQIEVDCHENALERKSEVPKTLVDDKKIVKRSEIAVKVSPKLKMNKKRTGKNGKSPNLLRKGPLLKSKIKIDKKSRIDRIVHDLEDNVEIKSTDPENTDDTRIRSAFKVMMESKPRWGEKPSYSPRNIRLKRMDDKNINKNASKSQVKQGSIFEWLKKEKK